MTASAVGLRLWLGSGAVAGPFDSFLALRGLKTLALRMRQASESALHIAGWLEKHARVAHVFYPGLPSHAQHELAKWQMKNGYSGIVIAMLLMDVRLSLLTNPRTCASGAWPFRVTTQYADRSESQESAIACTPR